MFVGKTTATCLLEIIPSDFATFDQTSNGFSQQDRKLKKDVDFKGK